MPDALVDRLDDVGIDVLAAQDDPPIVDIPVLDDDVATVIEAAGFAIESAPLRKSDGQTYRRVILRDVGSPGQAKS